MIYRLWDCLTLSQQQCIFDYQTDNHDKRWEPPRECFSRNVSVQLVPEAQSEVARVMEATPAEVKHWPAERV